MHHLLRTNLSLGDLVKKLLQEKKEHHLKHHIVKKKNIKTWDWPRSTFVGWLPPPGFPTYMLHFREPQLRETSQSTLEIACSPAGRGGPFASPNRQPWIAEVSSWSCAFTPSFSLKSPSWYKHDHALRPTNLGSPSFLHWILQQQSFETWENSLVSPLVSWHLTLIQNWKVSLWLLIEGWCDRTTWFWVFLLTKFPLPFPISSSTPLVGIC